MLINFKVNGPTTTVVSPASSFPLCHRLSTISLSCDRQAFAAGAEEKAVVLDCHQAPGLSRKIMLLRLLLLLLLVSSFKQCWQVSAALPPS
jgi:hypothetical protein